VRDIAGDGQMRSFADDVVDERAENVARPHLYEDACAGGRQPRSWFGSVHAS
jgi:hypothetical protein